MNQFLTPGKAIEFLREQGYPLRVNPVSARSHLLRLGDRGLIRFTATAGGHRRYREADLLEFLHGMKMSQRKCDQCGRETGVKKVKIEGKHDFVWLCAHCRDDDRYKEVREAKRHRRHYD